MRFFKTLLLLLAFPSLALAGEPRPTELEVCVVDDVGDPISAAAVIMALEGDVHPVNTETRCFRAAALYTDLGSTIDLEPGMILSFLVVAPGYAPEEHTRLVDGRLVWEVELEPTRLGADWAIPMEEHPLWEVLQRPLRDDDAERLAVGAAAAILDGEVDEASELASRALALSPEGVYLRLALESRAFAEEARYQQAALELVELHDAQTLAAKQQADRGLAEAAQDWLDMHEPGTEAIARGLCVTGTASRQACE